MAPGMTAPGSFPRPPRILVVDDEEQSVLAVSLLLVQAGYAVSEAANGHQALALLAAQPAEDAIDALVLDLHMPVLDGLAVLRALAAAGIGVPVVVMSGYGPGSLDSLARRHAIAGLLHKPFAPEDLLALVERALAPPAGARPALACPLLPG